MRVIKMKNEFEIPRVALLENKINTISEDVAYLRGKFENIPEDVNDINRRINKLSKEVATNDKKLYGVTITIGLIGGIAGAYIKALNEYLKTY